MSYLFQTNRLKLNRTKVVLVALALCATATPTLAHAAGGIKPSVCRVASLPRITANPSVALVDGVIQGALNASHTTGAILKYELVANDFGAKVRLGSVPSSPTQNDPDSFTVLPYGLWIDGSAKGVQTFSVRVSESPDNNVCAELPDARPRVFPVSVDVAALAPGDTPVAFTYKVESFDGRKLSTNFFPATGLNVGETAPSVMLSADLGQRGFANPYRMNGGFDFVPGPKSLRLDGYNVLTWDHRGTFASGGLSQLGSTFHEGRDVSSLVSWAAGVLPIELNGPGDPTIGMVGAGFGGTLQLVAAASDPRIDAIIPVASWYSLDSALHPGNTFRKGIAKKLLTTLSVQRVRGNPIIEASLADAVRNERMNQAARSLFAAIGPGATLQQLQAPTLLLQSSSDARGTLNESLRIAETILNNPFGTQTKLRWFDRHNDTSTTKIDQLLDDTGVWLETYVAHSGSAANLIPDFHWWDQNDLEQTSDKIPSAAGFNQPTPLQVTSVGGSLEFKRQSNNQLLISTLRVPMRVPAAKQIVGSPSISFTYEGIGDGRAVYVRIIDKSTGRLLGGTSSPVPVVLDGQSHTVSVALHPVVFSAGLSTASRLIFQIRSGAPAFPSANSGSVSLTDVSIAIPVVAP